MINYNDNLLFNTTVKKSYIVQLDRQKILT